MRRISGLLAAVTLAVVLARCTSFVGVPSDVGEGASELDAAATDEAASPDGPAPPVEAGRCNSGCPGTAGACGARTGLTWIDAREVTVAGVRELDDNIDGCEALASALATTVAIAIDPGDSRERQSRGYSRVKLDAPGLP